MSKAPIVDEVLLRCLQEDLVAFTPDAVEGLLGPVAHGALGREQALPARRACRAAAADPTATLTALFVLGEAVPRAHADAALPRTGTDGARRLGLVGAAGNGRGDAVRALVDLRPYAAVDARGSAAWWVASDLGEVATGAPLTADHVLGVGGASATLARATIRTPVARVLDLGTGCGVQALHAARHAVEVVATDLSRRALEFAAFNLALNAPALAGCAVGLRHGDLLAPVRGEEFDLVVSNPPFVITPRRAVVGPAYDYRDAGGVGDDVVRRLVTGIGEVLAPGGVAQFLANWEQRAGQPWAERVGSWLDGPGCAGLDAWVVQREVMDPAEYAELWIRDGGTPPGPVFDALYEAWLDDFEARGVEAVGFGLVTLRRPSAGGAVGPAVRGAVGEPAGASPAGSAGAGGRLRRLEEQRGGVGTPFGEQVAAVLAAHDWLAAQDDAALLAGPLIVAADVTQERHFRPGEADPAVILLRQGGGFQRVVQVGSEVAAVVGACDGELTVGQLTAGLALLLQTRVDDVRADVVAALRPLVLDGFLTAATT